MSFRASSVQRWLIPLAVSAVLGTTKLVAEASTDGVWAMLAATALFALADLLAEAHLSVAVFLYCSPVLMVASVVLSSVALGALFAQFGASPSEAAVGEAVLCAAVGAMIGVTVRNRFLASCELRREGRDTSSVRLHLAAALVSGFFVLVLPNDRFDAREASCYLLGFGSGFLAHFTVSRREHRGQRRSKLVRRIRHALEQIHTQPLNAVEFHAVGLFTRRRRRTLTRLLNKHDGRLTLPLRIVKATQDRIDGQLLEAMQTLREGVNDPTHTDTVHAHLAWLLLALCYRDLGQREAMWMALTNATEIRADCLLLQLLSALCSIEDLPLPNEYEWAQTVERREEARRMLDEALARLPDAHAESALAAVVACGVPLTKRFVDDTYAYFLFKNGVLSPAKAIFDECLRQDSRSASSHLHLGEYNSACEAIARAAGDNERADQHGRAADFCLLAAVLLSRNRQTHSRRRAQGHLDANGGPRPRVANR